jgi:hypothetical protein
MQEPRIRYKGTEKGSSEDHGDTGDIDPNEDPLQREHADEEVDGEDAQNGTPNGTAEDERGFLQTIEYNLE